MLNARAYRYVPIAIVLSVALNPQFSNMSHLQYFDYEGFGDNMKRDLNYSQAVRIGDRIEVSGQGTGETRTSGEQL